MCGRFRLGKGREALKKYFGAHNDLDWDPRYNIAPTQDIATVRQDPREPQRVVSLMRWGLVPAWAKDSKSAARMINARCETAADLPAFRDALRSRRCLIPADGFYEWQKLGKSRQPYCFSRHDGGIFAFAGLWERWKTPEGSVLETCSILTTAANDLVREVHDRMPVILPPDAYDLWLDPAFNQRDAVLDLLKPLPSDALKKYPVSSGVNDVNNDGPNCCVAIEAADATAQSTLFPP